jgi:hypothetical protein
LYRDRAPNDDDVTFRVIVIPIIDAQSIIMTSPSTRRGKSRRVEARARGDRGDREQDVP